MTATALAAGFLPSRPTSSIAVAGMRGTVFVDAVDVRAPTRELRFSDPVALGDRVITSRDGTAEILVGKYALFSIRSDSDVRFLEQNSTQVVVQIIKGDLDATIARSDQIVIVKTPTVSASTYGGLIRVNVQSEGPPIVTAGLDKPVGVMRVADVTSLDRPARIEGFHVLEGKLLIQSIASGIPSLTIEAGRSVQVVDGKVGAAAIALHPPAPSSPTLLAAVAHETTAGRLVQYVALREMAQAEAVQHALQGASSSDAPALARDLTHVILSTSLGLPLPNPVQAQSNPAAPVAIVSAPSAFPQSPPLPAGAAATPLVTPQPIQPVPTVNTVPPPPPIVQPIIPQTRIQRDLDDLFDDDRGRGRNSRNNGSRRRNR